MLPGCPYKTCNNQNLSSDLAPIVRYGYFYRSSDGRFIQRFLCRICNRSFSRATDNLCFAQKKRRINIRLRRYLCSGMSMRRCALVLNVHRTTIARRLRWMGVHALRRHREWISHIKMSENHFKLIQFDELESFEHTKCKPLSVALAVDEKTRRILSFQVSQMPAKGLLSEISKKKYGKRVDLRRIGMNRFFTTLKKVADAKALIKSDSCPRYPKFVKRYLKEAQHMTVEGKRGCITGQGELKKTVFDPIFSLNHTCAMLRANVNRLIRRTWCTTKKARSLKYHLAIYMNFHNEVLI